MTLKHSITLTLAVVTLLMSLSVAAPTAQAETLSWSKTVRYFTGTLGRAGAFLKLRDNGQVNVKYVGSIETTDGAPIACGSTVPVGTEVRYVFKEHENTDTSWFLSGYITDSPYGVWIDSLPSKKIDAAHYTRVVKASKFDFKFAYAVVPPEKSVSGVPTNCTTESGGNYVCTASLDTPGTVASQMHFAATDSRLFIARLLRSNPSSYHSGYGILAPRDIKTVGRSSKVTKVYTTIPVPEQTIDCPLYVEDSPNTEPATPTLTSSCRYDGLSEVYTQTITASANDPDGDQVRLGLDWTNDSIVNQYTGYQSSGSNFTITKNWSTPGNKQFQLRAQDEGGLNSEWVAGSAVCTPPSNPNPSPNPNPPRSCEDELSITTPGFVRAGESAEIRWCNNSPYDCTIVNSVGNDNQPVTEASGSFESVPLEFETDYIIRCETGTDPLIESATIRVLPRVQET